MILIELTLKERGKKVTINTNHLKAYWNHGFYISGMNNSSEIAVEESYEEITNLIRQAIKNNSINPFV